MKIALPIKKRRLLQILLLTISPGLRRIALILMGVIITLTLNAQSIEIQSEETEFEYQGITYEVLDPYAAPMPLAVINAGEELTGEITLPEEFTISWKYANITVKAYIVRIEDNAFMQSKVSSITLPSSVTGIGDRAFKSPKLSKINMNDGILNLGAFAFSRSYLNEVTIPESTIMIDYGCFESAKYLTKVYLPSTLMALAGGVFRFCDEITDIYCLSKNPPKANDSDFGCDAAGTGYLMPDCNKGPYTELCVLHVPQESIELYKNAPGWMNFRNIVALTEDDIISSAETIKESVSNPTQIDYSLTDGELTVAALPGDKIAVYDSNGLCLKKASFSTSDTFFYKGSGIVILNVNNNSVKVAL